MYKRRCWLGIIAQPCNREHHLNANTSGITHSPQSSHPHRFVYSVRIIDRVLRATIPLCRMDFLDGFMKLHSLCNDVVLVLTRTIEFYIFRLAGKRGRWPALCWEDEVILPEYKYSKQMCMMEICAVRRLHFIRIGLSKVYTTRRALRRTI